MLEKIKYRIQQNCNISDVNSSIKNRINLDDDQP